MLDRLRLRSASLECRVSCAVDRFYRYPISCYRPLVRGTRSLSGCLPFLTHFSPTNVLFRLLRRGIFEPLKPEAEPIQVPRIDPPLIRRTGFHMGFLGVLKPLDLSSRFFQIIPTADLCVSLHVRRLPKKGRKIRACIQAGAQCAPLFGSTLLSIVRRISHTIGLLHGSTRKEDRLKRFVVRRRR